MNKLKYILTFFLLPVLTYAQELKFSDISSADGLSQSVVNAIVKDKYGYMWFGTQDGLNRYNGYYIDVFKKSPKDSFSLSDNYIWSLFVDDDGTIWIGTNGGGINYYNPVTNKFNCIKYNEKEDGSLPSDIVKCITKDKEGFLWFGTENGIYKYNPKTKESEVYQIDRPNSKGLMNNRIWALNIASNGDVLIGTYGGGLHIYQHQTKTFKQYLDVGSNNTLKVSKSEYVRAVLEDTYGNIWIGTNGAGLVKFNLIENQYYYFFEGKGEDYLSNDRIISINQINKDKLWIGTYHGLNEYNYKTGKITKYLKNDKDERSLTNNVIRDIYKDDNQGIVWLGTDGGGVNVYKKLTNRFNHYYKHEYNKDNTISNNTVMTFTEDKNGDLWIGTLGGGISVYNDSSGTFKTYDFSVNNLHQRILALHTDQTGKIWIGSYGGGINYYDPETKNFSKPLDRETPVNNTSLSHNTVLAVTSDSANNIWIGTMNGLNKYLPDSNKFVNYFTSDGLSNSFITSLYYDKKNNGVWVGTNDGLNFINISTNKISKFPIKKGNETVGNNAINCIYKDAKGRLWLATKMGLVYYNDLKNGHYKYYYKEDGLPNDYVYGILEDEEGNLWLSTNKGLSKFNPEKETFKNYFKIDGLQADEFNQGAFFKNSKGEMFFGGINGFNSFYPKNIIDNPHIPPVYITSFKLFEREVPLDTNISNKKFIELTYQDRFFSFEFVALDYTIPSKNMYSWKMEGLDDEWSPPTNRRYTSYNNLRGGDYIFRVKASNNDGVWNEEGVAIHIRIIPPFWETTWFIFLCIIIGVIIVVLFITIRENNLKKEKKVLEIKVAERTKELEEKNKDILSSIEYAKRIQEAILPPIEEIKQTLVDSFVLYMPKDIVSGDFYWFGKKNNKAIIAAVDCTGHGVPGAFMSMIGHNLLNQIIVEKGIQTPNQILNNLDEAVISALKQESEYVDTTDGMDLALCTIDFENNVLEYAGAYRPLFMFDKDGNFNKINGDKFPIGGSNFRAEKDFTNHKIAFKPGDTFYIFSDGFADQFGGPKGKKFMVKRLIELLTEIQSYNLDEQYALLKEHFLKWKKEYEQVDDILVIGFRL